MNGLSLWQPLAMVCAVVVTALVPVGTIAWLTVHRRARAAASRAVLPVRTASTFIDLDPRGSAPRVPAHPVAPPMVPPVPPAAPPAIAATTLAGRARAQIRVVATTDAPARAAFPRRASHLRLVPAACVKPLDSGVAAGRPAQDPQDARTA